MDINSLIIGILKMKLLHSTTISLKKLTLIDYNPLRKIMAYIIRLVIEDQNTTLMKEITL